MLRQNSVSFISLSCLIAAVAFACYILRADCILPGSIRSVWSHTHHWAGHFHVLAVGLLPIYVALIIFGTASLGMYFGSLLQRCISYFLLKYKKTY